MSADLGRSARPSQPRRGAVVSRVMIQRELNRACEGWGLLIKVLALIVGLILGVSFVVAFLGGGVLGFILTLIIGCGGLFGLFYATCGKRAQ